MRAHSATMGSGRAPNKHPLVRLLGQSVTKDTPSAYWWSSPVRVDTWDEHSCRACSNLAGFEVNPSFSGPPRTHVNLHGKDNNAVGSFEIHHLDRMPHVFFPRDAMRDQPARPSCACPGQSGTVEGVQTPKSDERAGTVWAMQYPAPDCGQLRGASRGGAATPSPTQPGRRDRCE